MWAFSIKRYGRAIKNFIDIVDELLMNNLTDFMAIVKFMWFCVYKYWSMLCEAAEVIVSNFLVN